MGCTQNRILITLIMGAALSAAAGCGGVRSAGRVSARAHAGTAVRTASNPVSGIVTRAQAVGSWSGVPVYRTEYLSPVYTIDRIFKSMQGPASQEHVSLTETGAPELLWITGYSAEVTGADGRTDR